MKKFMILFLVFMMGVANANVINPLPTVKPDLEAMLQSPAGRKNISEMKVIANERNTDIDVAFENYLIAKKNVSVARAEFNPIKTGHLLGISMGLSYLWAPLAIEAVLSIPTKIYNVSKNKFLEQAAYYNLREARDVLNNELAHLYYDILTHEVILKTIDEETQVLAYQEARWTERQLSPEKIDELKKRILRLGMERVDIYNMYVSELAAIRTLISTTDGAKYELAHVATLLEKTLLDNLDEAKLQSLAVLNSDKYKSAISLHRASQANVKQVKWSILSFSGLNFSYKKRVKEAKNEENIAELRKESTELEVKNNVLLQLQKLDSSLDVFANYNTISTDSLQMYADTYEAFLMGQVTEDAAIETSLGAIRDFRNKVVAHYSAWSSFDDFGTSANYDFKAATQNGGGTAQGEIERDPNYKLDEATFKVVLKESFNDSYTISLSSPKLGTVYNVYYVFSTPGMKKLFSDNGRRNYAVTIRASDLPESVSGYAIVRLDNGHEFNVEFKNL